MATWQVEAILTAPASFPQHSMRTIDVHADTIIHAIQKAEKSIIFEEYNAEIIKATRIHPVISGRIT